MITLRPAVPGDREVYLAWVKPEGNLDEGILDYPLLATFVAQNGGPVVYLPTHPVLMLESIGHNPLASLEDRLEGAEKVLESAEKYAKLAQMGEVVFLVSDERVAEFCSKRGWVKSSMAVMRKKVL